MAKKKPVTKRAPARKRVKTAARVIPSQAARDPFEMLASAPNETQESNPWPAMPAFPSLDLDELLLPSMPAAPEFGGEEPGQPAMLVTVRSKVSFYLGVFFGAVVVNVLVVALLAIVSV